ncbi:MAG: 50S ribosomal protein L18 [Deltaproteobacteria bacterium]|nr:50S ribosomal protein L18 [Deltaproteobacteria bacterium]
MQRGLILGTTKKLEKIREKRKKRVKSKIFGTEARPRLAVFRSSKHIYVQAVADDIGRTLAYASTLSKELRGNVNGLKKTEAAREVGKLLAKELTSKNVSEAVFDRGKFLYHGRVKALAEGAREEGLKF